METALQFLFHYCSLIPLYDSVASLSWSLVLCSHIFMWGTSDAVINLFMTDRLSSVLNICFVFSSICSLQGSFFSGSFLPEVWSGSHLFSHTVAGIVSSAAYVLTIVFGMGTGVSRKRIATRNLFRFCPVCLEPLPWFSRFLQTCLFGAFPRLRLFPPNLFKNLTVKQPLLFP